MATTIGSTTRSANFDLLGVGILMAKLACIPRCVTIQSLCFRMEQLSSLAYVLSEIMHVTNISAHVLMTLLTKMVVSHEFLYGECMHVNQLSEKTFALLK